MKSLVVGLRGWYGSDGISRLGWHFSNFFFLLLDGISQIVIYKSNNIQV